MILFAALAAGCGGSGYSYLANKEEKLYFKVPDDWTIFDTKDVFQGADAPSGMWVRGFAAGDRPTIESVFTVASDVPRGYVEVRPLDAGERDTVNLVALRGTNFPSDQTTGEPFDPLLYAQQNPDGPLKILDYDGDVVRAKGTHGVKIRFAIEGSAGEAPAVVDQTVLVDKSTTRRYLLTIGCSLECFKANKKVIQEVIESWTLEAT